MKLIKAYCWNCKKQLQEEIKNNEVIGYKECNCEINLDFEKKSKYDDYIRELKKLLENNNFSAFEEECINPRFGNEFQFGVVHCVTPMEFHYSYKNEDGKLIRKKETI